MPLDRVCCGGGTARLRPRGRPVHCASAVLCTWKSVPTRREGRPSLRGSSAAMVAQWSVPQLLSLGLLRSTLAAQDSVPPPACTSGLNGDTSFATCSRWCSRASHCLRCQCKSCILCNPPPPPSASPPPMPLPPRASPPPPASCNSGLQGDTSIEKCSTWCRVSDADSRMGHCGRCQCRSCEPCVARRTPSSARAASPTPDQNDTLHPTTSLPHGGASKLGTSSEHTSPRLTGTSPRLTGTSPRLAASKSNTSVKHESPRATTSELSGSSDKHECSESHRMHTHARGR